MDIQEIIRRIRAGQSDRAIHDDLGVHRSTIKKYRQWAEANNWDCIEADAFEDIPIIYEIAGGAGITFWEKLGFQIVDRYPHPHLQQPNEHNEFVTTLKKQAKSIGIPPEKATDKIVMRLNLKNSPHGD